MKSSIVWNHAPVEGVRPADPVGSAETRLPSLAAGLSGCSLYPGAGRTPQAKCDSRRRTMAQSASL
jgi:hypothetical protein